MFFFKKTLIICIIFSGEIHRRVDLAYEHVSGEVPEDDMKEKTKENAYEAAEKILKEISEHLTVSYIFY